MVSGMTYEYDDAAVLSFLENKRKLFPEDVAENESEAEAFLEDCMAVIADSAQEVLEYFEEQGVDTEEADEESILEASEVFEIGDGRYLIVEG